MKRILNCLILLILVSVPSLTAQNDKASKRDRLQREIVLLEKQLRENAGKNANALTSLSLVRKSIDSRSALLKESEAELKLVQDSIDRCKARADELQDRLDTLQTYYSKLVRNAYKNRDSRVWYMYILASDNLGQASRRFTYLKNLSSRMNEQAIQITRMKAQLDTELVQLEGLRTAAQQLRDERAAELSKLRAEESRSDAIVKELNREKKKYQKQLDAKRRQVESLNREIERLIASEINPSGKSGRGGKASGGKKVSTSVDTRLAAEFASNKGKLPWPCEGAVVEHFGQRKHPVYTSITMPFNNGVNLAAEKGTTVKAVFGGVVKKIIVMPGYNKCVLVQHGDYFTFYCKLASVNVKAGEKVKLGDVLGEVDTIDGQTQLHFQLWKGNKPQDPEAWLK